MDEEVADVGEARGDQAVGEASTAVDLDPRPGCRLSRFTSSTRSPRTMREPCRSVLSGVRVTTCPGRERLAARSSGAVAFGRYAARIS
ncbi:hypothetical protein I3F58_25315 [Streptomyces sp. MUM 203J]|uniref:hypothetical protein n=1 Tax=Streptomyces sp. MUM 203J TaxID=2791990 RepID=UPI001F04B068|nr:hypothetical protein [Streptomyces sp. MUM 203J]MCH0542820.1 hypothetical protein [Streptomyces sp. MUM 203J]